MNTSPIIALDFEDRDTALSFLQPFGQGTFVKVGMQLFYKEGPAIVHQLKERGFDVFLDLKLHDIPNTVKSAMTSLALVGADLVNVHAAGGSAMMEAAVEGLDKGTAAGKERPKIIAVTQLTSTTEEQMQQEQLIPKALDESVLHYARLAQASRMDGVVCSVWEAAGIAAACGDGFLKVTPGIRLASDEAHDQKRIATPAEAARRGSTHIVVGRSITQAADPIAAYHEITQQWKGLDGR
ncbi:orotidine 5'-phosphate decarboxylase [Sporosarcina sp. NCCP-2716]|uniref:orotidine-5'-phosphate decarboxylase n=1 Tax=Sporosarcina sp. NCCP-2716 TaxID=2943679 RepID=UPI00203FFF3E|nr:orotidine-5'-phosphate decarboxylase [Sporosarcina sp. NCCP-2716]GKV67741.1 orotidine 5'-phosphate decarboxylase [Sporosarcina sp. NCCP-2716]